MASLQASTTATEWAQLLNQLAYSKIGEKSSRKSLFVNNLNVYRLFDHAKSARAEGFEQKIRFEKIAEITLRSMQNCTDSLLRSESAAALRILAIHHMHKSKMTSGGDKQLMAVVDLSKQLQPSPPLLATAQQIRHLGECVAKTRSVVRSDVGQFGVYYLVTERNDQEVALKLPMNPLSHLLADRFCRRLGFLTPCYAALPTIKNPSEDIAYRVSYQAYTTLKTLGIRHLEERLAKDEKKSDLERRIGDLKLHVERPYMTFMNVIDAVNFGNLTRDDLWEILNHPIFLQQLGEMLLVDHLLNNTDRLSERVINTGNFMLLSTEASTFKKEQKVLALIDHDCNITENDLHEIKARLKRLKDASYIDRLLTGLVDHLNAPGKTPIAFKNRKEAIECVLEGAKTAAKRLSKELTKEALAVLLDFPPVENCPVPKLEWVWKIVKKLSSF